MVVVAVEEAEAEEAAKLHKTSDSFSPLYNKISQLGYSTRYELLADMQDRRYKETCVLQLVRGYCIMNENAMVDMNIMEIIIRVSEIQSLFYEDHRAAADHPRAYAVFELSIYRTVAASYALIDDLVPARRNIGR